MARSRLSKYKLHFVLAVLFVGVFFNQKMGLAAKSQEICNTLNKSNATLLEYIVDQVDRSKKSLPTITYYKKHPDELKNALNNIEQQRQDTIKAFAPVDC